MGRYTSEAKSRFDFGVPRIGSTPSPGSWPALRGVRGGASPKTKKTVRSGSFRSWPLSRPRTVALSEWEKVQLRKTLRKRFVLSFWNPPLSSSRPRIVALHFGEVQIEELLGKPSTSLRSLPLSRPRIAIHGVVWGAIGKLRIRIVFKIFGVSPLPQAGVRSGAKEPTPQNPNKLGGPCPASFNGEPSLASRRARISKQN
jgi:hypothetical protein